MAFSEKGAGYRGRDHIRDQHLKAALDDIASQVQSVAANTNSTKTGIRLAPAQPTALAISAAGGFCTAAITSPKVAANAAYILEYSTTPNFQSPQRVDNGISLSFERYLAGQTLYFRVASTLYTSALSPWVYFGPANNPTPTTF